jgi:hypothetical protein
MLKSSMKVRSFLPPTGTYTPARREGGGSEGDPLTGLDMYL